MSDLHLSDPDAFTLHLERDPLLRSTIVAVVLLDRPPRHDRLVEAVERATLLEPNFRRRLEPAVGMLVPPRWHDDADFDLSWHVRRAALPSPGTIDELLELARIEGTTAFDPVRPRWHLTVVEGLADGGAALLFKVHHALTDGIGGIQLAQHVVDLDRRGTKRPPLESPAVIARADGIERAADAAGYDLRRLIRTGTDLATALPRLAARWARRPLRVAEDVGRGVASVAKLVRPVTSTMSPVMIERRLGWRYHTFDVPQPDLQRAAHMAGGTLNDAFLAGIAGGMAKYHEEHGTQVPELRITMPISTRTDTDAPGGNHLSLVRFPIPLGDHDPLCRMLAIDQTTKTWRKEPAVRWSDALAGALNALPTNVSAGMLKHIDLVASNVPGFDLPVFVGGARVERFFALGPTLGAAANVTLMTYRGTCCIGLTTDTGAVPDDELLARCMEAGFAEVVDMGATWADDRAHHCAPS